MLVHVFLALLCTAGANHNHNTKSAHHRPPVERASRRTVTTVDKEADFQIKVNEQKIRCKVDPRFVSFAISAGMFNKSLEGFDFRSPKLHSLLEELSPAVIRIGGTRANFMYFESVENTEQDDPGTDSDLDTNNGHPLDTPNGGPGIKSHRGGSSGMEKHLQEHMEKQQQSLNSSPSKSLKAMRRKTKKKKKFSEYNDYVMSKKVFDDLYNLINSTGNTMLFDLNAFSRLPQRSESEGDDVGAEGEVAPWDSWNSRLLLEHVKKMKYDVILQLGNEKLDTPDIKREMSGRQVKEDYNRLNKLVDDIGFERRPKIVGPDVTRPRRAGDKTEKWLTDFLRAPALDSVDYLSWHQYYMDGREASEGDFLDPVVLDRFVQQSRLMKNIQKKNKWKKPIWITETSSAWGGGAENLSDRFAGVFPWIDKLGVAGEFCTKVVARQAMFSGKYQLIEKETLKPHPEYFASVLFKRLANNRILDVSLSKETRRFRVYARCAKSGPSTLPGSVVLIVLNLYNVEKSFALVDYELFEMEQYLLSAIKLTSDIVNLNGEPLLMQGDQLPPMKGKSVAQPVTIPPRTVGYYVVDKVNLNVC